MIFLASAVSRLPVEIPSPSQGVWFVGPIPLRAYSLAILLGIVVAAWLGIRRYQARGGSSDTILDVCFWAVPFGIVGGRLYHVFTTPELYFGPGGNIWRAFEVWQGGLGIWGAIALGAVGAYIGARRAHVLFPPIADALAPGILIAQAIGRLGNYFNQELFGAPTTLPWGLKVSDSLTLATGYPVGTLFHPTFLYEMVWNLVGAAVLLWADRRFKLGHGRVFWLYVVIYTAGRSWIEMLRIDTAEHFFGIRLNVFTSVLVFVVALVIFVWLSIRRPGRETNLERPDAGTEAAGEGDAGTAAAADGEAGTDAAADGDAGTEAAGDTEARTAADGETPAESTPNEAKPTS